MSGAPNAKPRVPLLIAALRELSLARDLDGVMRIVRRTAREILGADGATFVLRDGDLCFYADEDAIGPLWKGQRFPMETCISGWVMKHRESVIVPDIFVDPRIPADAYRPTFVKSMAMVPINRAAPVGAIGTYWASAHRASDADLEILQALADSASMAVASAEAITLAARLRTRTEQVEAAHRELDAFSYSVSHDLRAPLRSIDGFGRALEEDAGDQISGEPRDHLVRIRSATARMNTLIDDMLSLARISRGEMVVEAVDLGEIAQSYFRELQRGAPDRQIELVVVGRATDTGLVAQGDPALLRAAVEKLIDNAFKFTSRRDAASGGARIEIGVRQVGAERIYFVRDDGVGFDMRFASKLFAPFQRLHYQGDFPGSGVGLASAQRIIHRHGGRIWADSKLGEGTTVSFTLAPSG